MKLEFLIKEEYLGISPDPRPANKFIPNWFKELPNSYHKSGNPIEFVGDKLEIGLTMKKCPPVLDYLCSGYIIPLWADLIVDDTQDDKTKFGWYTPEAMVDGHTEQQLTGSNILQENKGPTVYKLNCPWRIKTPKGYSCYIFSPRYADTNGIEILPAVVDTDQQHVINYPFLYKPKESRKQTIIPNGTPVVQVFPFKREDWKMETKVEKVNRTGHFLGVHTVDAYKKFFRKDKKYR